MHWFIDEDHFSIGQITTAMETECPPVKCAEGTIYIPAILFD